MKNKQNSVESGLIWPKVLTISEPYFLLNFSRQKTANITNVNIRQRENVILAKQFVVKTPTQPQLNLI